MNLAESAVLARASGIEFTGDDRLVRRQMLDYLDALGLRRLVAASAPHEAAGVALAPEWSASFVADSDTTGLCRYLGLDTEASVIDLEREIVLAMLAAPRPLRFPGFAEFLSSVAIRRNIVHAARRTQLAFGTSHAERPETHWTYDEDRGFTVLPGQSLIEALRLATQPDANGGKLYAFSCYRATEYVILLGIAQELERVNPALLADLQRQWERKAIMSGRYHDVFLTEFGSMEEPLPARWYVPGDRVWFRNPDEASADASGYEGSWVIYLGNGLFANFWKRNDPYSFVRKCVEVWHWRHGTYVDAEGELRMDEDVVEARVKATMSAPIELARVLERMARPRDGRGVYAEGGCIDVSREFPRQVCPGTAGIVLPRD
ncbi:lipoprotein [Massilia terrae]|uniref:Transglutaminase domain-containing protein n=1 Tax=Massilia terrae TaxID=1811224 RepID=A0ABT2CZF9_9BURK|nr:hypothetical protein [Massilia terrae]MCS0659342.1 hypothetical protein [Massilia terrae]